MQDSLLMSQTSIGEVAMPAAAAADKDTRGYLKKKLGSNKLTTTYPPTFKGGK